MPLSSIFGSVLLSFNKPAKTRPMPLKAITSEPIKAYNVEQYLSRYLSTSYATLSLNPHVIDKPNSSSHCD